jgi:hypothetical protein
MRETTHNTRALRVVAHTARSERGVAVFAGTRRPGTGCAATHRGRRVAQAHGPRGFVWLEGWSECRRLFHVQPATFIFSIVVAGWSSLRPPTIESS